MYVLPKKGLKTTRFPVFREIVEIILEDTSLWKCVPHCFFPVHFQEQFPFYEADYAGQGSLCTSPVFAQYHAVICVSHKFVVSLFQFLVQFVQHDVI